MRRVALAGALAVLAASWVERARADEPYFPDHELGAFAADADADLFAGPVPFVVHFSATTRHAAGRVVYRWDFDDRSTNTQQNPVHTFSKPGWYMVTMDATDHAGHTYRMNLQLHAWRQRDWARLQTHSDMRIVQRAMRELERKRAKTAPPPTSTSVPAP